MPVLRNTPETLTDAPPAPETVDGDQPTEPVAARFPLWRELVGGGLFVALLIAMARTAASPVSNTDTYFHLRFGREFLDGWSLRHPGSVSSFATAPWVPTQWLPEVVMAKTEEWFGLAGVAWLLGLVLIGLLATLYLLARRWAGPLAASGLTAMALFVSFVDLSLRPQVLSFLLVAVVTAAWLRTREDGKVRWWLVPLTWVWATVHGMWPLGIAIGVVAVAGLALDRSLPAKALGRAALVPLLSAVVAALTPVGPAVYGAVLAVGARSQYFSEWGSPDFSTPGCVLLAMMLALTAGLMLRRGVRTWFDILLLMMAGACTVWSWRTVPVAATILVPLAAAQVNAGRGRPSTPLRTERLLVAGACVATLALLGVLVPRTADQPPSQPAWMDPALSSLAPGTKVVDSWDWGGYLMWRYPQLDLLMHGYGDTFTTAELQRNADILSLAPGWDRELKATGCTVAVLHRTALAYALEHQQHWTVLHRSPTVIELQAPAGWPTSSGSGR